MLCYGILLGSSVARVQGQAGINTKRALSKCKKGTLPGAAERKIDRPCTLRAGADLGCPF